MTERQDAFEKAIAAKLRDLATVARSEQGSPEVRGALASVAEQLEAHANKYDPPAIDEPQGFGSIVRASTFDFEEQLWTPYPKHGEHYWVSETGKVEVWPELTDVEVLRVGLGEPKRDRRICISDVAPCGEQDCNGCFPPIGIDDASSDEWQVSNAEGAAFDRGRAAGNREMNALIHSRLVEDVLPLAIATERRIGVEKAIQAVEELAP